MTRFSQGRDLEIDEAGSPTGGAIGGLIVSVLILAAAIGVGLILYGSAS